MVWGWKLWLLVYELNGSKDDFIGYWRYYDVENEFKDYYVYFLK